MLLPKGERAIVDIRKLRDYCLNPENPRGSRKARVFRSALAMTKVDAPALRQKLLQVAASEQAKMGEIDNYGQRYTIDFELRKGTRKVVVRSGWIILINETVPHLTTCYVRKRTR
jgi:hypothetical protein